MVVRAGDGALLGVEGGVRRSAAVGDESGNDGGGESSSTAATLPPSPESSRSLLSVRPRFWGRARAAEAAEALAAALEAKRKGKS